MSNKSDVKHHIISTLFRDMDRKIQPDHIAYPILRMHRRNVIAYIEEVTFRLCILSKDNGNELSTVILQEKD